MPNSAAARATIVNLSEPSGLHGVTLTLDVDPAVRPAVVVGALERAAASSLDVLARPAPVAVVKAFGTNAIRYEPRLRRRAAEDDGRAQRAVRSRASASGRGRHRVAALASAAPAAAPDGRDGHDRRDVSRRLLLLRAVDLFARVDGDDLAALADALVPRSFGAT